MTAHGDGLAGTYFAGDYKRMGRDAMLARARRGYSNGYLVVALGGGIGFLSLMLHTAEGTSPFTDRNDPVFYFISVILVLIYALILNRRHIRYGTRAMISTCTDSTLAEARRAVAASGIIPQLLTGKLTGREHLRYFPLTMLQHIGTAVTPELKIRRAIESMSYNCKWYLTRCGMCREHIDMLPWVWFVCSPLLLLTVMSWLAYLIGTPGAVAIFLLFWLGVGGFIYLRLNLNKDAGCYELAFYDELASCDETAEAVE